MFGFSKFGFGKSDYKIPLSVSSAILSVSFLLFAFMSDGFDSSNRNRSDYKTKLLLFFAGLGSVVTFELIGQSILEREKSAKLLNKKTAAVKSLNDIVEDEPSATSLQGDIESSPERDPKEKYFRTKFWLGLATTTALILTAAGISVEKPVNIMIEVPSTAPLASTAPSADNLIVSYGHPTSTSTAYATSTAYVNVVKGFVFEFEGCERVARSIECKFSVENLQENRQLRLHAGGNHDSRIFDNQGNKYIPGNIKFGDYRSENYVQVNLIKNTDLDAVLSFEEVPHQVNQLPAIYLTASSKETGYFSVLFRDVPVSR